MPKNNKSNNYKSFWDIAIYCMEAERKRIHSHALSGLYPNMIERENEIISAIENIKSYIESGESHDKEK